MSRRHRLPAFALGLALITAACSTGLDAPPLPVLECSRDWEEITDMLESGLPTYDYEPAVDLADLVARSDIVAAGEVASLVRTSNSEPDDTRGGESWTVVGVQDWKLLTTGPTEPPPAEGPMVFSISSGWPSGVGADPLSDLVGVEGMVFVAFLDQFPAAPGSWVVEVQGLFVSCVGSPAPIEPIIEPPPPDVVGMSVDELVTAVIEAATSLR